MYLGQKVIRDRLIGYVKSLDYSSDPDRQAVIDKYLETVDDGAANQAAAKALIDML